MNEISCRPGIFGHPAAGLLAAILLTLAMPTAAAADLVIRDAWIPEAPPTARMLAGYLTLSNPGDGEVVVTGAESEFGRVEIHRSEQVDGVSRMRRQDAVEVAPGETVRFRQGGLHLMIMGFERAPAAGTEIPLALIDADGNRWPFRARVRPR